MPTPSEEGKMKKLIASLAALAATAPAALAVSPQGYTDPLAKRLHVSPSTVKAGSTVRVYGSAAGGCAKGDVVTIYSNAFKGATTGNFAGIPAVSATVGKSHNFSRKVKLSSKVKPGKYHMGARCGGGNLGAATLTVTK
jgi:hypothetical protein